MQTTTATTVRVKKEHVERADIVARRLRKVTGDKWSRADVVRNAIDIGLDRLLELHKGKDAGDE